MKVICKIFIVFVILYINAVTAYSQEDCKRHLKRAAELVSQDNFCEAINYYRMYSNCDADADVSTEIAMCERRCKSPRDRVNDPVRQEESKNTTPNENWVVHNQTSSGTEQKNCKKHFGGFQLHGGIFLPQGDFSEKGVPEIMGKGYAVLGYNFGFKVYTPIIASKDLSWFIGAEGFYNGLHSDYKEILEIAFEMLDLDKLYYNLPFYLNVPITTGFNYAIPITNSFRIYGEVAGGLNISNYIGFNLSGSIYGLSYAEKHKWKMATGFTYGLGTGMLINGRINIGFKYYNLGAYKYEGDGIIKINGEVVEKEKIRFAKQLPVSGLSFKIGILF